MKTKYLNYIIVGGFLITSGCNIGEFEPEKEQSGSTINNTKVVSVVHNTNATGRFSEVKLSPPLDNNLVAKGQAVAAADCSGCHKLTDEKLIGPGWKGVTDQHSPEWIMNFITNTQVLPAKDGVPQSEIVTCVVRMPRQDISDEQARAVLEFMRKNDGKD